MTLIRPLSQVLALGLLLTLAWGFWSVAAAPQLRGIETDRDAIAASAARLARMAELIRLAPAMRERLNTLTANQTSDGLFETASAASMEANLQSAVQRLAGDAGADISRSSTIPVKTEEGLQQLGLDLELTISAPGLQRLLSRIETTSPAIFIDHLTVGVPESGNTSSMADGQPGLAVTLRLASFAALPRKAASQ